MRIQREIQIDYGHTLPNHFSFCNQIHGHRGRILATVEGEPVMKKGDSSQGMVMDFKFLKQIMMENIHEVLDHGFAVWEKDKPDLRFIKKRNKKYIITKDPPTAEYLAKWAFEQLEDKMPMGVILSEVTWFETPSSCATYSRFQLGVLEK